MRTELTDPVSYFLPISGTEIPINNLLGKPVSLKYTGQINCIVCGKLTKTSYNQGFCYNCLQTAPEASETIIRPELSKAQFGIARDMAWAEQHDLIDHYVYLALSSELKVGVTRQHQVPTRWIDQGASSAIFLAKTPNRHIAGVIEVWLKKYHTDKTNWRNMLQNKILEDVDLAGEKAKTSKLLPAELRKYISPNDEITRINYPVLRFPEKIINLSFDSQPEVAGTLAGIKAQYLIFEDDSVINLRRFSGYHLVVEF